MVSGLWWPYCEIWKAKYEKHIQTFFNSELDHNPASGQTAWYEQVDEHKVMFLTLSMKQNLLKSIIMGLHLNYYR